MSPDPLAGFALEPLVVEHLAQLFALNADERVWTHLPSGRHTDPSRSLQAVAHAERSRSTTGLGPWAVRELASGRLAGTAGVAVDPEAVDSWNLGYRFHPDFQGRGLAGAAARAAIEAARSARPDLPVVARILETNPTSIRLAERLGLVLAWRGEVPGFDGAALARRIYGDRALGDGLLERLIALG